MPTPFDGFSYEFLAPYYAKGDCFESLLARSTYLSKYCRDNETWTDTIKRVVYGNIKQDLSAAQEEAEALFDLFWYMRALPPGRGLWTGGVDGIPADARYNCWFTTIRCVDDWAWLSNMLMLGGGVGAGLQEIDKLPTVNSNECLFQVLCCDTHPNLDEVNPVVFDKYDEFWYPAFTVPDSREGWVDVLRLVLNSAFLGEDVTIDVSNIRERGKPIRTFGGIACGPGPLVEMLRAVWDLVRGASGRQLTTVEALDVTNHIGKCIKSGNVRRSALIALANVDDRPFRDAKKDLQAINSHRHTSNNSIAFKSWKEIREFDWATLVEDVNKFGEPGITNFPLVWQDDSMAKGVNPCGEQFLWDREACNLAEVFPARIPTEEGRQAAIGLVTRYCLRQRLAPLSDAVSQAVGVANMRVGVAIGGFCDFEWTTKQLSGYFVHCRTIANAYAHELGVASPITVTTVKPSGTISLLNGSSPGMHAPFAPFSVRRVRIAKNDPMTPAMIAAGVPHEEDVTSNRTWVFSFPCRNVGAKAYATTQTIREQFERQVQLQECWADNAVSATLSFQEHEKTDLVKCLKEFVPRLKSTSLLPHAHGYAQAPYEEITEEEYFRIYALIDHASPLVRGGEIEVDECASGVCPVR